jgi:hypothetical protein
MENKQYKPIDEIVKALKVELNPIFEEVGLLSNDIKEIGDENDSHPLLELIPRLTKTARRHDIENKVKIDGRDVIVGTNHQGLGYQGVYSSQLEPLVSESRYNNNYGNHQNIRDILFDSDAVIDLTAILKKSSQKTFLKLIGVLKKHNLVKSFNEFKKENVDEMKIDLGNKINLKIRLDRRYNTTLTIVKEPLREDNNFETIYELGISNDDEGKPIIRTSKENHNELKTISPTRYNNLSLSDIKALIFLTQHSETIVTVIKSKRELINSVKEGYRKEIEELNDLLNPLLALEKL